MEIRLASWLVSSDLVKAILEIQIQCITAGNKSKTLAKYSSLCAYRKKANISSQHYKHVDTFVYRRDVFSR